MVCYVIGEHSHSSSNRISKDLEETARLYQILANILELYGKGANSNLEELSEQINKD